MTERPDMTPSGPPAASLGSGSPGVVGGLVDVVGRLSVSLVAGIAGLVLVFLLFGAEQWHPVAIVVCSVLVTAGLIWIVRQPPNPRVEFVFTLFWACGVIGWIWQAPRWSHLLLLPIAVVVLLQICDQAIAVAGGDRARRVRRWPTVEAALVPIGLVLLAAFLLMEFGYQHWMLLVPALGLVVGWGRLSRPVEAWCARVQADRQRRIISNG